MAIPTFRKEMAKAWSVAAMLFVLLPILAMIFAAPTGSRPLMGLLLSVGTLLAPVFLVGFVLAPWAGRQVGTTKAPAFAMAAAAAITSAATIGVFSQSWATTAFVALFALPGSLIGALLFIAACERVGPFGPTTSGR